jgi:hypothetical protein
VIDHPVIIATRAMHCQHSVLINAKRTHEVMLTSSQPHLHIFDMVAAGVHFAI